MDASLAHSGKLASLTSQILFGRQCVLASCDTLTTSKSMLVLHYLYTIDVFAKLSFDAFAFFKEMNVHVPCSVLPAVCVCKAGSNEADVYSRKIEC